MILRTQVAEQKDYKSLQKDINLKCKEFKLNYEIVLEYINYLASLKCQCLDIIGKGSFGFVIKAIYQNNLVAIKIIEVKNEQNANKLKLEQQLLEKFQDSKYILNLRKTLDAKLSSPLLFIFTDLCQGELTDLINKNIPKKQIISIIIQLLIGLEELKSLKILHVDIKPQNILYNYENGNYLIKIADFGQAKQLQDKGFTISLSRCGTPKYTSQEVLDQDAQISYKSDIYSLGIVFIELIFGRLFDFQEEIRPLRQGKLNILSERPKVQNRSFDQTDDFLIEKIIKNMIQKNQNERKDSDELLFLIFKQHLTDLKYYQICLNQNLKKQQQKGFFIDMYPTQQNKVFVVEIQYWQEGGYEVDASQKINNIKQIYPFIQYQLTPVFNEKTFKIILSNVNDSQKRFLLYSRQQYQLWDGSQSTTQQYLNYLKQINEDKNQKDSNDGEYLKICKIQS
ncbi:hypothetical protein ABPG72_002403 [Tetrahymena utriculariae]